MIDADQTTEIRVKVAECAVGRDEQTLITIGLGSCVAIVLYDSVTRIGGLAHTLLPDESMARDRTNPAKFPASAVTLLLAEMTRLGADATRVRAKLVGGASMFANLAAPGTIQMGERNIAAARAALRDAAIRIVGEAVGGERGRSVRFWPQTGRVETRTVGGEDVVI